MRVRCRIISLLILFRMSEANAKDSNRIEEGNETCFGQPARDKNKDEKQTEQQKEYFKASHQSVTAGDVSTISREPSHI